MSTLTPTRPDQPWAAPGGEHPDVRDARLALRRRLVVWSLPAVVVLLLVAVKLLTMVSLGNEARAAYDEGALTRVEQAASRLGILNLIERHKAPFARGDALVLAGDLDGARGAFEEALGVAPQGGVEACQIRVNLVLTLERLGDAALASAGLDAAKPYYDRVQVVVGDAPRGCFQPPSGATGQQLGDARSRAEQKSKPPPTTRQPQQGDPSQPSQDKQRQLDDKTRKNQQERAQGQGQPPGSSSRPQVDKPW